MIKDGGPAFPALPTRYGQPPGMTLRDWFAGQALIAFGLDNLTVHGHLAEQAYQLADAMLAERGKG